MYIKCHVESRENKFCISKILSSVSVSLVEYSIKAKENCRENKCVRRCWVKYYRNMQRIIKAHAEYNHPARCILTWYPSKNDNII